MIELALPNGTVQRVSHAIPGAYQPSTWGQKYHDLAVDEALGGGSAGPGKSLVLLMDANDQIVLQHLRCQVGEFAWGQAPGWALHLRKEFPRLKQTIDRAHKLFLALDPNVHWERTSSTFTFSSGYQYQFGHLAEKDSYLNYRSNEYTWLGIDELGEIDEKDAYDELVLRVRSTDRLLRKMLKVRSMTNPCANWVREHFVDPNPKGGEVLAREIKLSSGEVRTRTRVFLPARLSDNPDPEFQAQYETSLRDRPVHIKRALFDGDWYVVPGAFFAELWDASKIVVKPFSIPAGWRRFRTGDWGYKDKCVILWWAVHPDGAIICYRERVYNGAKAKKLYDAYGVAQQIRNVESAHREWNKVTNRSRIGGWMDTQLWEERGHRGRSMADDMAEVGVFWTKVQKGRVQAAQQMIKRLNWRGYDDMPGIVFFDECKYCISTIPSLGTDEDEPEAPKQGGDDHGWDAVSYAVAMNPLPSDHDDRMPYDDDDDERVTDYRSQSLGQYGYGQN